MAETTTNRAEELLEKALKHCPENSTGRLALLGAGFALIEVRAELAKISAGLKDCRTDIGTLHKLFSASPPAVVRETMSALAADLPSGIDRIVPCRSCDAPMFWASTTTGKKMPMDAKPSAAGEFGIRSGAASKSYDGPYYTSHFATCPNANDHRKPREGSKQ